MSKIAIITDTHLGARSGSKVFRNLFREYYRDVFFPCLEEHDIHTIYHLGDFFDNRNSVSLHDVDYVMNEFLPLLEEHKVHMTVIAGNHDVAFRNTNKINSLSMLKASPYVTVIDNSIEVIETECKNFVFVPWMNSENQDEFLEELKYYANDDHICLVHASFNGMKMYKNSPVCEHGLEPTDFNKFHKVLSGHFHHPNKYGNVEYLGALFHFNWQDYDDWRGFHVYDPETNEFEAVENPYCLFDQFIYYDGIEDDFNNEDLSVEGQIIRVIVNEEHDKVKLKDFINRLEKSNPVSVDVIDNTVVEREFSSDDQDDVEIKELHEYAKEALEGVDNGDDLMVLFNRVHDEAKERMKEIE